MRLFLAAITMCAFQIHSTAMASADCQAEAQIIAKVSEIIDGDMYTCRVAVDMNSITFYNVSQACPLELSEVLEQGISFDRLNGHDCPASIGREISGVLVQIGSGKIILE